MREKRADVVIIGGGASGLCAAIAAARGGAMVLVVDGNDRVGRKLLSTGNGRCNFGNERVEPECYRSGQPETAMRILSGFPPEEVLSFFEELGVHGMVKNGSFYPYTNRAGDVRDCLELELMRLGVRTVLSTRIRQVVWDAGEQGFFLQAEGVHGRRKLSGSACIVATGGYAFPKSGSDGSGYAFAQSFGHRLTRIAPALVELFCKDAFFRTCKGIRLRGGVRLFVDGVPAGADTGELQLTDHGISGIPVFNVSRFASLALLEQRTVTAELDLLPELSGAAAEAYIRKRFHEWGWGKSAKEALCGLLHPALAAVVLERAQVHAATDAPMLSERECRAVAGVCKAFSITVCGYGDEKKAQTTAGGIPLDEVDGRTLESRFQKGLYFCGELLDVDAICGGYNLMWAWASGLACGRAAAER